MEHFASLKATLARLESAKLAGLGGVALVMLVLLGWVATRSTEPMALLYSGLDPAEGGRIGQRLDELKIPYEASGSGDTIKVPASQVARIRMELAANGLPHQAGAGYELLDSQSPMNMTSFMQRVQRVRALEGELARTILTLDGIRTARVHIVLPERESFSRDAPQPTASVAITMAGAERISARQAAAIRLLVAGAVPRLHQEQVSVVDPSGVVLAADGSDAMASNRLDEIKTSREQALRRAATDLLEPLIGRGRVRVAVSVDVDPTREVAREEKFDPLSQVERSKQSQVDKDNSDETKPRDPVSVGQNLPNQLQQGGTGKTTTSSTHDGQTVNYELNSTHSERVREPGEIRRIAVAAVVDGTISDKGEYQPRSKEEMDRIAALVRSAVGFDAKRGDTVTVETMRFVAPPELTADATEQTAPATQNWPLLAGAAVVVIVAAAAFLFFRRRRLPAMAPPVAADAPTPAVNASPEPLLLASEETSPQRQLIAALNHVVDTRHDEALAVLRAWIAEGEAA
jgi:flagellar M-ring protein FliF